MKEETDSVEYKIEMLKKSFDYGKKKIIYHENSHLLFSYFFGMSCRYVDYTILSDVQLKNNNIEMEFESRAQAYIEMPPVLEDFLVFIHHGGKMKDFISKVGINKDMLINALKAYLNMLYAGYEAERFFFDGKEYSEIKNFILQYSEDFTVKNIAEDEIKAKTVLKNLDFNQDIIDEIRKNAIELIQKVLNEDKMKNLFDGLYQLSLKKQRLSKDEIESYLEGHQFSQWSQEMIIKIKL